MSVNYTINGVTYPFPEIDDTDWGTPVTSWAGGVTVGMLQKAGGAFTLLADVDFGANYGLASLYYKSRNASVSSVGVFRLGNAEALSWRNAANSGNLGLTVNASNILEFNSNPIFTLALGGADTVLKMNAAGSAYEFGKAADANIAAAAAIAYSKLALTNSIVNADVSSSAAIAYSKLALTGSIVNADIAAAAAIAVTKLAAVTASRALVSDGSGFVSVSAVTTTELGYVSGVTSAIQTQLNAKLDDFSAGPDNRVVRTDGTGGTAVQGSGVAIDDSGNVSGVLDLDLASVTATEISTPSTPASSKRKIYPKTDGWYDLDDAGLETKLGAGGSGSGEVNVIESSSVATDWGVSGGGIAVATTTTSSELPLAGVIDTAIKITPSSGTDYAYYRWTMPVGLHNTKLKLAWNQRALSGYASGDLKVEVRTYAASDYTGASVVLPLASDSAGVTGIANATGGFQTSYDSDASLYYELRVIRVAGTTALTLANVVSGPGLSAQGAIVGAWQSYTPTGSWANTTYQGKYKRDGTDILLKVGLTLTGAPSGTLTFTTTQLLNGLGLTYDSTSNPLNANKMSWGQWQGVDTGIGDFQGAVAPSDATASIPTCFLLYGAATLSAVTATAPFSWNNTDELGFEVRIPIAEWAGSGTVNLGANGEEFAWNSDTTNTDNTVAFAYGLEGVSFGSYATTNRAKRVRFTTPIQATDVLTLEVFRNNRWIDVTQSLFASLSGTTGMILRPLVATNTDVDVLFGSAGYPTTLDGNSNTWSAIAGSAFFKWRVRKSASGQAVGFGAATAESSGLVKGGTVPGQVNGVSIESGYVGQIVKADVTTFSAWNTTTGNYTNLLSLAVPAGIWQVFGHLTVQSQVSNTTNVQTGVTTVNAAAPANVDQAWAGSAVSAVGNNNLTIPFSNVYNFSSTTTLYVNGRATFSNTPNFVARIIAVRIG